MFLSKCLRQIIKSNNSSIIPIARSSSALAAASSSLPNLTLTTKVYLNNKQSSPINLEAHFLPNHLKLNIYGSNNSTGTYTKSFPYTWLRANCLCPSCYSRVAEECEVDLCSLDTNNTRPAEIIDVDEDARRRRVRVHWHDGHKSEFELADLVQLVFPKRCQADEKILWNKSVLENKKGIKRFNYNEYLNDEEILRQTLTHIYKFGAAIIEGVPSNKEEIARVCDRIGPIQTSHFGSKQCVVEANLEFVDRAYTQLALRSHTDTAYLKNSAGLELFHIIRKPADGGGKSLLVDGFYCADRLKQIDRDAYEFLTHTKIEIVSHKPNTCHYRYTTPVIKTDWCTGELVQIRFNPYNKVSLAHLNSDEIEFYYSSMKKFMRLVQDESNEYWISLNPDEVLIFDNFRLLHGRSAFQGHRVLVTAYISRDDWLSKARVLNVI